ncbi:CaiB/BaiF CoA transferase family protein [Gordonia alkanivorans]|uniref:CaiB/BaiF CoA transferase family protein n=1 Tax=Gordonia alkanivorans TaxID=84096 RepID=UPI0024484378|nr:CoA transferase [Gordonia alkanivorans]MDH3047242.1 CoA transferase [Gordonia alkanivorans]
MTGVMDGVKVVELAGWTFVPTAGAVLADWGADVIKVEDPVAGDPQRGLSVGAVGAKGAGGVSFIIEQPNRGKRSLGLDVTTERGRELLLELVAKSDVFLTSMLAERLEKLRLTVDDIRAANPAIIIARGTGFGVRGAEANKPGFDGTAYLSRGGVAHMIKEPDSPWPPMQRPAFGDIMGGFMIASGIAGALFKRERTGEPSIVDVSLLGAAAWHISPDLVATGLLGEENLPKFTTDDMPNPIVNYYKTSDGRFVQLMMLQADKFWPEVCELIERPELITDERFANAGARFQNRVECVNELRKAFEARPLTQWRERMDKLKGAWAVVQTPSEVLSDPQVIANDYIRQVTSADGSTTYGLVANPVQYDESPPDLTRAPSAGEHTDAILQEELGLDWDTVVQLKVDAIVT